MPSDKEIVADIARELRENPKSWTQHAFARDPYGESVAINSPYAQSWCLLGHIKRRTDGSQRQRTLFELIRSKMDIECIAEWNDLPDRDVKEVILMLEQFKEELE